MPVESSRNDEAVNGVAVEIGQSGGAHSVISGQRQFDQPSLQQLRAPNARVKVEAKPPSHDEPTNFPEGNYGHSGLTRLQSLIYQMRCTRSQPAVTGVTPDQDVRIEKNHLPYSL